MSDFIYVLVTLVSFAGLAALVGVIDRRLAGADDLDEPHNAPSLTTAASREARS